MAKSMTKADLIRALARSSGITKKEALSFLDSLVATAYKEAKHGFTLPGLGKLVIVNRKARMGRNPRTGGQIEIPVKRVLKFRVAKIAKHRVLLSAGPHGPGEGRPGDDED